MPAVKISSLFRKISGWQNFAAHFYNYKVCGELPSIFGRDGGLDLSEMHHIHLAGCLETQIQWSRIKRQHNRTASLNDPGNDFWLIYAYDVYHDNYLLLTVMGPDAHSRTEWGSFLRTLHSDVVMPWILGRNEYPDIDECGGA
ncbi:type II toxin-antitoxin system YafO family toxin [Pseudomonas cedrina]|uniref:type II toxin-antitoxin system YafO family toxin n=1 Tax=Pseudomonas cedrina TaxID=651740 RepID=UPI002783719A|nr:type II toxin-antitoxin system YafO family toxin [Pseudomonas cedrina]MDQ0650150.1 mRNA interferase YafO [Pseudomonas cedrina]